MPVPFPTRQLYAHVLSKYIDCEHQPAFGCPLGEPHVPRCAPCPSPAAHPPNLLPEHASVPGFSPFSFYNRCCPCLQCFAFPNPGKHLVLKFRTCQVCGNCSPGPRSSLNGPLRCCGVSPASHIKARRPCQHALGDRPPPGSCATSPHRRKPPGLLTG